MHFRLVNQAVLAAMGSKHQGESSALSACLSQPHPALEGQAGLRCLLHGHPHPDKPQAGLLQAEAERFVTRPFLMGSNEAPPPTPSPALSDAAAHRAELSAKLETRKTTSIFTPAQ